MYMFGSMYSSQEGADRAERPRAHFTHFAPVVTSYVTVRQHSLGSRGQCGVRVGFCPSVAPPAAATHPLSILGALSSRECDLNGVIQP